MPAAATFQDVPKTDTFAWDVEWMVANGLATANPNFFPARNVTRDEIAAFLCRSLVR
ncbi:MAG: S-layer homology domain-containing protein [Propionibacteriaceae bacterium]|nr:S-layer homology domain-containing protein [Propionibacteriaceae bacterium]